MENTPPTIRDAASEQPKKPATAARYERELKDIYESWLNEPKPRPDFLTFAHFKRRITRI